MGSNTCEMITISNKHEEGDEVAKIHDLIPLAFLSFLNYLNINKPEKEKKMVKYLV